MKFKITRTVEQEVIIDLPFIIDIPRDLWEKSMVWKTVESVAEQGAELLDWNTTVSRDYNSEVLDD
jgi:hypothetical protein